MAQVRIRDVSPRLGLQAHDVATENKVELVERLIAAGVPAVEVSSFVSRKMVPGLADAEAVFARISRPPGVSLECCVGNLAGLERAIDSGAHVAWFLLAADEEFSRANIGRSIDDSLAELARMREAAARSSTQLGTYVIAAFGGPVGLARGPDEVRGVATRLLEMEVRDWILADSCGYAAPPQIREMVCFAAGLVGLERLTVQVHDSRGMGLADVAALVDVGLTNVDLSLAGSRAHPASARCGRRRRVHGGRGADAGADGCHDRRESVGPAGRGKLAQHVARRPGEGLHAAHRAGAYERLAVRAGSRTARTFRLDGPVTYCNLSQTNMSKTVGSNEQA